MTAYHRNQYTIAAPTRIYGFGFWSGLDVCLEFRPAAPNAGIHFVRSDLPQCPRIAASVLHRVQGPRRTTLVHQGCAVEMVEHVLAALAGLQIDNCEIWINRPEMPGLDGSSLPFVDALVRAGKVEQAAPRAVTVVAEPLQVGDEQAWIRVEPHSTDQFELKYLLEYPDTAAIPDQEYAAIIEESNFIESIAPARTFVLQEEAELLRSHGLGKRVTTADVLVFAPQGLQGNSLRYANECARHKLLDMVGDFSLLGTDIVGSFTAYRSGHLLNSKMVLALLQASSGITRRSA